MIEFDANVERRHSCVRVHLSLSNSSAKPRPAYYSFRLSLVDTLLHFPSVYFILNTVRSFVFVDLRRALVVVLIGFMHIINAF